MLKRKVGDRIEMRYSQPPCFRKGDIGILYHRDEDGDWWADFSTVEGQDFFADGRWCVGREDMEME